MTWLAGRSQRFWIVAVIALPLLYIASFGPAGITDQAEQALLYGPFYERMRSGGSLGEIIRDAKAVAVARDPRVRPAVEGFNLIGDPTLPIASTNPVPPRPRGR